MSSEIEKALRDAHELIRHLHASGETQKAALAREIHDEIAGLMVAAVMDLSVASRSPEGLAAERVRRAHQSLVLAIDHSRRMVEQLRPSILDNFGLFAALKWQIKRASEDSSAIYTEWYPEQEPQIGPEASIALFRIAEDALAMTLRRGQVTVAELQVRMEIDHLVMEFSDNGIPVLVEGEERDAVMILASMRHRLYLLEGTVDIARDADGTTVLSACVPLQSLA